MSNLFLLSLSYKIIIDVPISFIFKIEKINYTITVKKYFQFFSLLFYFILHIQFFHFISHTFKLKNEKKIRIGNLNNDNLIYLQRRYLKLELVIDSKRLKQIHG